MTRFKKKPQTVQIGDFGHDFQDDITAWIFEQVVGVGYCTISGQNVNSVLLDCHGIS